MSNLEDENPQCSVCHSYWVERYGFNSFRCRHCWITFSDREPPEKLNGLNRLDIEKELADLGAMKGASQIKG